MSEITQIPVANIDPESDVNVRRQGIEENVENVKASIQEHGYWQDQPIIVRPHPDPTAAYDYQHVTGQCRLKACLGLGLEEIPAFVIELSDDDAIQRSWLENEVRGDLTYSDRAYWTERIYNQYAGAGYTGQEALELAAKYLGVQYPTVIRYFRLSVLPEDLKKMVDMGNLTVAHAGAIVQNTFDASHFERSQRAMTDRASWLLDFERDDRLHAIKALEELGHQASIADLTAEVREKMRQSSLVVEYAIPTDSYEAFLEWGKQRGLEDESTIISHMVADVLTSGAR